MARYRDDRHADEDDDCPRRRSRSRDDDEDTDDDRPARRRRRMEEPKSSGGKTAIIVISILGGLFLVCGGAAAAVYFFTIKPAVDKVKDAIDNARSNSDQSQSAKQIGLGLHNNEGRGTIACAVLFRQERSSAMEDTGKPKLTTELACVAVAVHRAGSALQTV